MKSSPSDERSYFCDEPWTGIFTIKESATSTSAPAT